MYEKKDRQKQNQLQFITLEGLAPKNHRLRIIDKAIDFSFIYEEVKEMYSPLDAGHR